MLRPFSTELIETLPGAYLPCLPKSADDLGSYCVVVGVLLRSWLVCTVNEKHGCPGLKEAVQKATSRRMRKLANMKGAKAKETRIIIEREERMMNILVKKVEDATGIV